MVLVAITALALFERVFEPPPGGWLEAFGVTLLVFVAVASVGLARREPGVVPDRGSPSDLQLRLAFFSRLAIHAFFLSALLLMGLAVQVPLLLLVALIMLALELPLAWVASRRSAAATAANARSQPAVSEPQRYADVP